MSNFFVFLDSFGLFLNNQLIGKRKKTNIFLKKWTLGVLSPQGPPRALCGSEGQIWLANDVSKAKNLVQIFSGENACFSQSRPDKYYLNFLKTKDNNKATLIFIHHSARAN